MSEVPAKVAKKYNPFPLRWMNKERLFQKYIYSAGKILQNQFKRWQQDFVDNWWEWWHLNGDINKSKNAVFGGSSDISDHYPESDLSTGKRVRRNHRKKTCRNEKFITPRCTNRFITMRGLFVVVEMFEVGRQDDNKWTLNLATKLWPGSSYKFPVVTERLCFMRIR